MPFSVTSGRKMIWCGSSVRVVVSGLCVGMVQNLHASPSVGLVPTDALAEDTSASSAALVTSIRRVDNTLWALRSLAGDIETPTMLRALRYTLASCLTVAINSVL